MDQHNITIYTDGSCIGNPGPGGWAALLMCGENEKVVTGNNKDTTNNRMELTAVIEGLACVESRNSNITIYSDSKYVVEGAKSWVRRWRFNGWRTAAGKPVMNMDLWQELVKITDKHTIRWLWVKAHNGNKHNERVDGLAQAAAMEML